MSGDLRTTSRKAAGAAFDLFDAIGRKYLDDEQPAWRARSNPPQPWRVGHGLVRSVLVELAGGDDAAEQIVAAFFEGNDRATKAVAEATTGTE